MFPTLAGSIGFCSTIMTSLALIESVSEYMLHRFTKGISERTQAETAPFNAGNKSLPLHLTEECDLVVQAMLTAFLNPCPS